MNPTLIKIVIVSGLALVGAVSYLFMGGKHDNPIEETSEKIIYVYTGADVDLTPHSPEIKDTPILDLQPIEDELSPLFDVYDQLLTDSMGDEDGNE